MSLRPPAAGRTVSRRARWWSVLLVVAAVCVGGALVATPAYAADTGAGTFHPVTSNQRILDTRAGSGPVGAGQEISLDVTGALGLPAGAVAAVVLNLTGVGPTVGTFLTAYPSQTSRPTVSTLSLTARVTRANLTTVPVGVDGRIRIYNLAGTVHVLADVVGYYARAGSATIGSQYYVSTPTRLYDSRTSQGGAGPLAAGSAMDLFVDYAALNADVVAVTVNVTALNPTAGGFLVAWDGAAAPTSSTLNFRAGDAVPNLAVVPTQIVGGRPSFSVANGSAGTTDYLVDLVGAYVRNQSAGLRYTAINADQTPTRIVDTRTGTGGFLQKLSPRTARTYVVPSNGAGRLAGPATYAMIGNVTATGASAATYFSVYRSGDPRPTSSTLNVLAGQTVANAAVLPLANDFSYDLYNHNGTVHAIVDVTGRFDLYAPTGERTTAIQPRAVGTSAGR